MHTKYLRFLLFFLLANITAIQAQVLINEFSAANFSDVTDSYGNHEDWIELYNAGAVSVDLSGYHLSDDLADPTKWTFPSGATINTNGFLRVWCSNRDTYAGGAYHTNFKITQTGGDNIVFADAAGVVLDSFIISVPNQSNHSYGRYPNGAADWFIFTDATPNTSNTTAHYTAYADKPNPDPNSGNYTGSVDVSITTADPDLTIRYTTNGNFPTAASTLYSGPITITSTKVLRCVAFSSDPNILPSFCATNTYFIDETSTIPVISVAGDQVDNLLDGDGWIEPVGSFELFNSDFTLIDEGQGQFDEHGNDSWGYPQRSFDYVTKDQLGYNNAIHQTLFSDVTDRDKYQRLIVKDAANDNYPYSDGGAHLRDAYTHHLSQLGNLELDERSTVFCLVFLNGEYWGVYDCREKVDDADYTGYYYDQTEYNMDFIQCWGGTWAPYGTMASWPPFVNFVTTNDMTDPANYTYVKDNLETLSLIDYILINTMSVCKDWLNWNTEWWRGYNPDGGAQKWRYCLWDEDATYGHYINYTGIPDISAYADPCDPLGLGGVDPNGHIDMVNALMDNDEFFSDYVNRYADLNNTIFSCDQMVPILDSMVDVLDPEMTRQIDKWGGTYSEWSNNVDDLREFIETRCDVITAGIEDCFDVTAYPITVQIVPAGSPNNVKINTIVPSSYDFSGTYFSGTTLPLKALPAADYLFDHWEFLHHTPSPSTTDDTITVSLSSSDTIIAYFIGGTLPSYDFSIDIVPPGAGSVTVNTFTPAAYPYATSYASGTIVDMDAVANAGYVFDYWEMENHIVNPSPFSTSGYFALATFENTKAHYRLINSIDDTEANGFNVNVTPNVTSGSVVVSYQLTQPDDISAVLYSITGAKVADVSNLIINGTGSHSFNLNLTDYNLAGGMYLLKMQAGSATQEQRIMFMPQ